MINSYIELGIASLFPVIASVVFYLLGRLEAVKKIPYIVRQIFLGLVFGFIAIIGTEWGIPMNGAQVNCRDAAPICAGLVFGAPAGIIAGVIGGVERWIAVAWGVGTFTRVACSVSTVVAGIAAAFFRIKMFDNKKPGWLLAAAMAFVVEIFHLSMVFVTNLDQAAKAAVVVKTCVVPMVIANTGSVMLACMFISLLSKEKVTLFKRENIRISQSIQRGMFALVTIAFAVTTVFIILLQNELVKENTTKFITQNIADVSNYVEETSDKNQIATTKEIARDLDSYSLDELSKRYEVAEINVIDKDGIITKSTNPDFVGFDMKSTDQSKKYMQILDDIYETTEMATPYEPIGFDSNIYRKYAAVRTETGMLQIGYDASNFQAALTDNISSAAHNRHIGETGFILIADSDLNPVSTPDNFNAEGFWKSQDFTEHKPNEMYELKYDGVDYCAMYESSEGYYIVGLYPSSEAYQMRDIVAYVNSFMEILVFAAMFVLIYLIVRNVVVNKINKINKSLNQITEGNLDTVVDVRTNEEFDQLSNDINATVDKLKDYIAEAAARIDAELEFAKKIQSSSLPSIFPAFPNKKEFDIYACMFTAKEVGGDFYDFYLTDNNTLNILMADVSGKGIPAALFMMRGKTELKSLTEAGTPLDEVFTKGNNALCEGNDAGLFITAWQASINLESGLMTYANAGHNPPIIGHADGTFEYISGRPGFVLAGMEDVKYKTQEYQLLVGDTVYIYTDGVTEATDAMNELYGEDRLIDVLNKGEFTDVKSLCEKVKTDVDEFVGEAPQFDDITMLAVKYFGKQN